MRFLVERKTEMPSVRYLYDTDPEYLESQSYLAFGKDSENDDTLEIPIDKIEVEECICVDCNIFGCNENCQTCKATGKATENFQSERMRND